MSDRLLRALTTDGCYRIAVARTSALVTEAARRHEATRAVSLALARALTSAALLSISEKDYYRIGVQWTGRGPVRSLHVDVRPGGRLRGYAGQPGAVGDDLLGKGVVNVIEQDPEGRFTRGTLPLSTGEVDEDLEAWLCRSEQVPSRLRVVTDLGERGGPIACAGVLVQTLPGGAAEALLGDQGALSPALDARTLPADLEPEELLKLALPDVQLELLGSEPLRFECHCSRERVERGVAMLGADELADMIDKQEPAEVRCDFCAEHYSIDVDGLRRILAAVVAGALE